MLRLTATANDPARRGQKASPVLSFGPCSRFRVYAVHTRFDAVEWFVADTNITFGDGSPMIIRQEPCFDSAIAGLA